MHVELENFRFYRERETSEITSSDHHVSKDEVHQKIMRLMVLMSLHETLSWLKNKHSVRDHWPRILSDTSASHRSVCLQFGRDKYKDLAAKYVRGWSTYWAAGLLVLDQTHEQGNCWMCVHHIKHTRNKNRRFCALHLKSRITIVLDLDFEFGSGDMRWHLRYFFYLKSLRHVLRQAYLLLRKKFDVSYTRMSNQMSWRSIRRQKRNFMINTKIENSTFMINESIVTLRGVVADIRLRIFVSVNLRSDDKDFPTKISGTSKEN